jgi:hypothetical protein
MAKEYKTNNPLTIVSSVRLISFDHCIVCSSYILWPLNRLFVLYPLHNLNVKYTHLLLKKQQTDFLNSFEQSHQRNICDYCFQCVNWLECGFSNLLPKKSVIPFLWLLLWFTSYNYYIWYGNRKNKQPQKRDDTFFWNQIGKSTFQSIYTLETIIINITLVTFLHVCKSPEHVYSLTVVWF